MKQMKNSNAEDKDLVHEEAYLEEDGSLEEILEDIDEDDDFEFNEDTIREIDCLLAERELLEDTDFEFDLLD